VVEGVVTNLLGNPAVEGIVINFTDITDRKRLELEIEERRLYLEGVLASAPDAMVTLDAQHRLLEWNAGAERLFGYTPEEVRGRRIDELITGSDPSSMEEATIYTQQSLKGESVPSVETIRHRKDGSPVHVILSASPILINNEVVGGIGVYSDITESKRAGAALQESEAKYRLLVENQTDLVVEVDVDGRFQFVSPSYCEMFGKKEEELLDRRFMPLIHEDDREATATAMMDLCEPPYTCYVEQRALTKHGWRWLAWADKAILDQSGNVGAIIGVGRDITDRKQAEAEREKLQAQLLQAQRMETVGQLAGGIAHDFNNLLTSINGFAELMRYQLSADDPVYDMAGKILRSGQRAADLVSQLLAFSRKQMIEPRIVNLNHIVVNMNGTLEPIVGPDVQLTTTLAPDLGTVEVDPKQFEHAISELAINASDAMPEGGKLTIETANVVLGEEDISEHVEVPEGDYVLLAVSDTGAGLSDEARDRIFEPFFFTSPDVADGIGLRLAAVYGIVKQNDGYIWAESEAGQGTTFKICLPHASTEVTLAPSRHGAA
jgi:PAS domain S-box-containing protein